MSRSACTWIVIALNVVALALAASTAYDAAANATAFLSGFSVALAAACAGAFAFTTLPALILVGRWPWQAMLLALAYPLAWFGIMRIW